MYNRQTIQIKICPDCGEEIRMLVDNSDMLIHYEKMCPCLEKVMELRKQRPKEAKTSVNTLFVKRKLEL